MPKYFFIAKSQKGESLTGIREAKDKRELVKILRQEDYFLISATLKKEKIKKSILEIDTSVIFGVPLKEKLFFTRNLQIMIASGLALPRALLILSSQCKSKKFEKTLLEIKEEISKGKSLSESLVKYPAIFSELFQGMVKVGEETGQLEGILKILTRQMEREHDLKTKIKGAMVYPAVIICAMLGIGALMLITVVPQLAETFKELGIELPMTTKLIIGLSSFLVEKWYIFVLFLIFIVFLFWHGIKTEKGRRIMDALILKMPIISSIVKKTNSAYTVRTLSSLISSGVPLVRALEITANALSNVFYKTALNEASQLVKKGEKLSSVLRPYYDIYPLTISQMIEVGEETGETSKILVKLADFFEEEVTNATKNLATVIEPVLMIIIGIAVGFFAISMLQPMYGMLGAI